MRTIDVSIYKYNFEGFYENLKYPMYINKRRTIKPKGAHILLHKTFFISSLSLSVKSVELCGYC